MTPINALLFDDDDGQLLDMRFSLEEAWKQAVLPNGDSLPQLVVIPVSRKNDLLMRLSSRTLAKDFDFLLCDIYMGTPPNGALQVAEQLPEPEGLRFIRIAKDHGLGLCFAITTGRYGQYESTYRSISEFNQYVDKVYLKAELRGVSSPDAPKKIINEIAERLSRLGRITPLHATLAFDTHIQEARTLGIVEELGETTINSMVSEIAFKGASSVKLSSLSPGLSGAKILKLTFSGDIEDFSTRPILLKISRDRASLVGELQKFHTNLRIPLRGFARTVAQPTAHESPVEANGWHGIAFECAAPALSLIDWLTQGTIPSDAEVGNLLNGLFFNGGLSDLYTTTKQEKGSILAEIDAGLLSNYRRMAILEAINEFGPLLSKHVKGRLSILEDVRLYMEHGRLRSHERRDLNRRLSQSCLVHGDFHGRNVVVTRRGQHTSALVIDLASMQNAVWPIDLVRLICDVFLSGWDRGSLSFEWSGLKSWVLHRSLLARHSDHPERITPSIPNAAVSFALDWLFSNKFRICGIAAESYHQAEFSIALAVEFARAAYRDRDMTAPKRAFAILMANLLFKEADQLFSERD